MKDLDTGEETRLIDGYGENVKVNLRPLPLYDVRSGTPYLSIVACNEINQKCNEFFIKRGMPIGKDYSRHLNKV